MHQRVVPDIFVAEHHQQRELYDREYGALGRYRLENWQQSYIRRLAPLWNFKSAAAAIREAISTSVP